MRSVLGRILVWVSALMLLVAVAPSAQALIIASDNGVDDWADYDINTMLDGYTTLVQNDADVHGTGMSGLEITGGASTGLPHDELILESVDLATSWNGGDRVQFQFYVDPAFTPLDLSVLFLGASGGYWLYDLAPVAGWNTYTADLEWGSWYDTLAGGGMAEFLSDLQDFSVLGAGVRINYELLDSGALYGLRNYIVEEDEQPAIPEPQTIVLLGCILLPMAVLAKRRKLF